MTDDPRVDQLLEELLDSSSTPEEICRTCPELLPQVRAGLRRVRLLEDEVSALFPPSDATGSVTPAALPSGELPRIPGYEVEAVLGHGGVGVVYKARHLALKRTIALKMLLSGPFARPEERDRFRREAEALAGLRQPNVVQVYDSGELDGRPYFTMEYVEGGTLAQKLAGTPQPAHDAAGLVATLADAVRVAHEGGIIHRDLKPSNVLLTADGTPKVSDFGLARRVEAGAGVTRSGAAMGTPSYMAPEQARGETAAVGPAVDVYALGAILYECLTGRPPFRAESAIETFQQVISQEPVPPSRLNARVPRDLETICLKCLEKDPHRRYASAAALADDLRRFGRGEPIAARPLGRLARLARWSRCRPALATALAAGVLLSLTFASVGAWWYEQRSAAARAAEVDAEVELRQAEQFEQKGDYARAADALERAKLQLRDGGPAALRERLARASSTLQLLRRLDAIRLERALFKGGVGLDVMLVKPVAKRPDDGDRMRSGTPPGRRYEEAFRAAGLGVPGDDPAESAARVEASPVHEALVAALDDWSACAVDQDQQDWVLQVVKRADPDPWRDRVRDPATWDDREALGELAAAAPVAQQKPQLLVVLGVRLRAKGGDARGFLTRVVLAHPTDFWANVETGNTVSGWSDWLEAIGYYRAALAIRPETASIHRSIGRVYHNHNQFLSAIPHYEEAIRLDPKDPWDHNELGDVLIAVNRLDDAIAEFRKAVSIDPNYAWGHQGLAVAFGRQGRYEAAIAECREAVRLRPEYAEAKTFLRNVLRRTGRWSELRVEWQKDLAANPAKHDAWFGYAELCLFLGEEEEYRRARRDLLTHFAAAKDPQVAERTGRACLLLPASDEELLQAAALAERAVAAGRSGHEYAYPYFLFVRGLAEYRKGHFDDAITTMKGEVANVMGPCPRLVTAMAQHQKGKTDEARKTLTIAVQSFDWSPAKAAGHDAWIAHILRREAEKLIGPVPPLQKGK